jgi:trehalose-phosphatase
LISDVRSQLEPFLQTVAQAPCSVLFLDYDGTLAPFQTRRDRAYPYPGVEPSLQEIVRNGRTRVVVITGRDANDIVPLLNIHPLPEVWGIHGMQRLRNDGSTEMPHLDERTLHALSDAERWVAAQRLRHTAEFKAAGIAVHWRGLNETDAEDIRSRVMLGWRPIAKCSGLNLLDFDGGIEIRPRQADKGTAVRRFLGVLAAATPVAYLGDDSTDEAAFQAMQGRGVTVLVRPKRRPTAAQFWLKPPEQLLDFLGLWLKRCTEHDALKGSASAATIGQSG